MKSITKILFLILVGIHLLAASGWTANQVTIDEKNRVILNGQPFFPIGLYVVQPTIDSAYTSELDELADSPFDTVVNYAMNSYGGIDATSEEIKAYLDALQARNLKTIFSISDYFSGCNTTYGVCDDQEPLSAGTIDSITDKVENNKTHDALIAWYMNDESCPDCLDNQLLDGYNLLKTLDPDHPVWSVHWNTSWLLQEVRTTDIVGADSYPIPDNPITWVSNVVDDAMEAGKPLWFVPQLFEWWGKRAPTKEEMRAMTYLATNHGAKGLVYYSYFDIRGDGDYQERWDAIRDVAGEIRRLRHVFMSTDQTNVGDVTCENESIDFKLMRVGGSYYLLAVNTAIDLNGKPTAVDNVVFSINLNDRPENVYELFADDEPQPMLEVSEGQFTSAFGPYEVRVYQWQEGSDLAVSASSDNILDLIVNSADPNAYDGSDKPRDLPYGLLEIDIKVEGAGDTAVIDIQLSSAAPPEYSWYKYVDGAWIDFDRALVSSGKGDGAVFSNDRTKVSLYITDNGPYDDDPADSIILDPSGLGSMTSTSTSANTTQPKSTQSGGGGGGGGCFITSLH